ncbi:uncharacterized protein TRAVEDRAFT_41315 [Trametes versicolor FP-101664 SS1]|uniref:uncharacterized protein n=1 Tax=Trametes versicolor (strain FP-101664) TaxID=717944 RepID=UPI00046224FE|nr:uncharacterized protein TRAVEDRAFT_41315 [Trametes versicolor FP-101664 SS1]EIW63891.1 hypothetical protein TRAVEDRAFT_41315 [Trametes versicolor FP-101664 SS1]
MSLAFRLAFNLASRLALDFDFDFDFALDFDFDFTPTSPSPRLAATRPRSTCELRPHSQRSLH